jgi:hypothetical protein
LMILRFDISVTYFVVHLFDVFRYPYIHPETYTGFSLYKYPKRLMKLLK